MSVTSPDWDVVVVGAGPAGASAALGALAQDPQARVLLIDRADFPRDKCCGDGIAPHVLDALRSVGAADVTDGWTPIRHLELARGDVRVEGPMARPVFVIPRQVFDARLVERATAAGATLLRRKVTRVARTSDGARVHTAGETFTARVVVGADGVHSVVRTGLLGAQRSPRAIAVRGYTPTSAALEGRQVIRYGQRQQPAYAWAFDRGDGLSNVGYGELLPGAGKGQGAGPSKALLLEELERLIPGSVADGTAWTGHHLPLSGVRWDQPDGPVLLVGDAASLVNPMTGEGIYYAVATGILAGRAAARAAATGDPAQAGRWHREAVRGLLRRHLRHTWLSARLAQVPVVVDAGIVAAGRDRRVFDTLVEIGLGDGLIDHRLAGGLVAALGRSALARSPFSRFRPRPDASPDAA